MLVTGAGGFVGGHVARHLAGLGHEVVAGVHRRWPPTLDGLGNVEIMRADLAGDDPLPGRLDAVVHCAAALPSNVADENELVRINVESMSRLAAHALGDAGARVFINCSSMSAFGRIETDVVTPETPVCKPGAYGRSKLEGERILSGHVAPRRQRRALSLRLPGVVGRGSGGNFLSKVMSAILAGEPVRVLNPDAPFNNIVHVADLAAFCGHLLRQLPAGHRVATIAADTPLTIRQVVSLMYRVAGRPERTAYGSGGRPFLISPEPARALGYTVPSVADSVCRFVADSLAGRP